MKHSLFCHFCNQLSFYLFPHQLHKALLAAKEENNDLLAKHNLMQEQIELYQKQYQEIEKDMGNSTQNFGLFR